MLYQKHSIIKLAFLLLLMIFANTEIAFANGGTGKGDGDGTFGYQSSSESKIVRTFCGGYIRDVDQTVNEGTTRALGNCLMEVREMYKHRPPYMRNMSKCSMLDSAAAESCAGHWGLFGLNHQGCKTNFIRNVGRNPGWYNNFGYCNESCPRINPPDINTYPIDLPPCGINTNAGF